MRIPGCLLLLLLCWQTVNSSPDSLESDEVQRGEEASPRRAATKTGQHIPDVAAQERVILNPFNIFGNPSCMYNGDEGRCYGEVECLALAGNYGSFCPGLLGLCCLFYRSCNQRTSQEVSYFRNVHWPLEDEVPTACTFKVIRRSDNICGLKLEATKVDLPTTGNCINTVIHVTGAGTRRPLPLCGRSTGLSYNIDIRNIQEVKVHVNSTTRSSAAWNIKLSQVLCSDFGGDDTSSSGTGSSTSGSVGSGGAVFPPPIVAVTQRPTTQRPITQRPTTHRPITQRPTTQRPTARPPHPPAPPPAATDFGRCGLKPNGRKRRDAEIIYEVEDSRKEHARNWPNRHQSTDTKTPSKRPEGPATPTERSPHVQRDNPFLRDLVYPGTSTNDSLFAYWKGPDDLITSRITFGETASLWEYPWQVAMFVGGRYHCGASVIGDWFILTAAHCVVSYKVNPSNLRLSLGDWDVSNSNDGPYIEARVAKVRVHPSYSRSTLQNDLAVLKLTKKIEYSERVRPICLPSSEIATDGSLATITGWGRDENKHLKVQLQELTSEVVTNSFCGQMWKQKKAPSGFIVGTMMCMSAINGDSCNGDSGGPAVMEIPKRSGNFVQVGIVSFGSGSCTDADLPGVYTRVSKFRDWIRQQMY